MSTVDTWPGRGYYRGDKKAFLADAERISPQQPPEELGGGLAITDPVMPRLDGGALAGALTPVGNLASEAGVPLIAGAAGTWVKPVETVGVTDVGPSLMSSANAQQMGYTGDACDHCGSMKMQRTGHCNTCAECGTTTGCS